MIVLCSLSLHGPPTISWLLQAALLQHTYEAHRRSNTRTEPSADTEAKTPTPPHAMSYTSLSCAMSCVSTTLLCKHASQRQLTCTLSACLLRWTHLNVPNRACRISAGGAQPPWIRLIPVKRREGRAKFTVFILHGAPGLLSFVFNKQKRKQGVKIRAHVVEQLQ